MPIDVPSNPKVYTTVYDNFKGVDFTNDSTNIWRRRSPTGTNMLPDASGRPFKRHGWDVLLSNEDLCTALSVGACEIQKCAYFELAGKDHIVVFTDNGAVFYNGADTGVGMTVEGVTAINTDVDFYLSYDRCFFFEGNGVSAFYVYGDFRVWKYYYDNGFVLAEATDELYIPTILIGCEADCVGTTNEAYNLLGNLVKVQYNNANLYTYWGTDGLSFSVLDGFKTGKTAGNPSIYAWKYDGSSWVWNLDTTSVAFDATNILPLDPRENDEIVIIYAIGVMLPNNIDLTSQSDKVKVRGSTTTQFDTKFDEVVSLTGAGEYILHDDTSNRTNRQAWIEFYSGQTFPDLGQEDVLEVQVPSTEISTTTITNPTINTTSTTTLNGEAV